jgi:hypothetical protein
MTKQTEDKPSRRDFLKLAGTSAPAALAVTALSSTQTSAQTPDPSSNTMQDTAHTRAYLESVKF